MHQPPAESIASSGFEAMRETLREIINGIRENRGLPAVDTLRDDMLLRNDLEMDSLDLAEFSVHLEYRTGIDVFARGLVHTIREVEERLENE